MTSTDPILSPVQASAYLGRLVAVQTLARWRGENRGPAWVRVGGRIGYRRSALDTWLRACECTPHAA